jgi:hypothetical protein
VIGSILIFTQPGITVSLLILSGLEKRETTKTSQVKITAHQKILHQC